MSCYLYDMGLTDQTPMLPTMQEYISDEVMMQYQDEIYYCIATND